MANYYVNLVDGNDTTGNGTIATPWKTIAKATAVGGARTIGDVVYVTKTPGTVTLIGTGSTSNAQSTITTSADYTGSLAIKDYISLSADGFPFYQITAISSTSITIHGTPFFDAGTDTALSTVSIYRVPTLGYATGSGNWDTLSVTGNEIPGLRGTPFDWNTTYGYNILISGGWSTDFTVQDGHTLIRNTTPAAGFFSGTFLRGLTGVDGYKINRISGLNFQNNYTGALATENRMVFDDCIFGYASGGYLPGLYQNCRSYLPTIFNNFVLSNSANQPVFVGNTPTETNAVRPALLNHNHFLSYSEYTTHATANPTTTNRGYQGYFVNNITFRSALRSSDYNAGDNNNGKFPILGLGSQQNSVVLNGVNIIKNPNVGPIARIFSGTANSGNTINIDSTILNAVTYSGTFSNMQRQYNTIRSTNGDIFNLPGTFKTINQGDNMGVYPYCNNVVVNNDGTKYQWDGNFVSSIDNTFYNTGSNSVKVTKITNYVSQQSGYFIGDIELTNNAKTISVVLRGSKNITQFYLNAYFTNVNLGQGYFLQTSTNYTWTGGYATSTNINSTTTTLSSLAWTTINITLPANFANPSGKVKLSFGVGNGTNMVNGDNIWIDSITIA